MSDNFGDQFELVRFVEAIALGEIADQAFADACRQRGLRPADCIDAPLAYLTLPHAPGQRRGGARH